MTGPVTVSIVRHVDPGAEDQMLAWLRAGTQLSERFEGFLGSGWVRPSPESTEWHMLYRFADDEALQVWESSPQRRWWLSTADEFVESTRQERRTGIEGWFDEPSSLDVADLRPVPTPPPRWKQMCAIFLVFFPLSLVANELGRIYLSDWWLPARVLLTVCAMTPLMTYVFLPWVTKRLSPWLNAAPRNA